MRYKSLEIAAHSSLIWSNKFQFSRHDEMKAWMMRCATTGDLKLLGFRDAADEMRLGMNAPFDRLLSSIENGNFSSSQFILASFRVEINCWILIQGNSCFRSTQLTIQFLIIIPFRLHAMCTCEIASRASTLKLSTCQMCIWLYKYSSLYQSHEPRQRCSIATFPLGLRESWSRMLCSLTNRNQFAAEHCETSLIARNGRWRWDRLAGRLLAIDMP